jgi:hypothetical protein
MDKARRKAPGAWASWLNVLLGIWLIVSPFALGYSGAAGIATWNSVILGVGVIVLAYFAATSASAVPSWWNILLAIWLVISPYVLSYDGMLRPEENIMGIGMVIGVLAFVAGIAKMPPTTTHTARG